MNLESVAEVDWEEGMGVGRTRAVEVVWEALMACVGHEAEQKEHKGS